MHLDSHQTSNKKPFILDEIEIEDIPFKPITDGLGFNKNISRSNLEDALQPRISKERVHKKNYQNVFQDKEAVVVPVELEAFYKEDKSPRVQRELSFEKVVPKNATLGQRFTSEVIDLFIVAIAFAGLFLTMFASTSFSVEEFLAFLKTDLNALFPVAIYILLYVIYSVALGFRASVGQALCRIKPLSHEIKLDPVAFLITRSLLELLSLILLGLPHILNFDYKILGNRTVRA